jgi:hypothetical protein
MRIGFVLSIMSLLCAAVVAAGCITSTTVDESEEDVAEVSLALGCNSDCDCPLGSFCGPYTHMCKSRTPPGACYSHCQCPGGQFCVEGTCMDEVPACFSDCDCPPTHVCQAGQCNADFGPTPQCRCDYHCVIAGYGVYVTCQNNTCVPYF